MTKRIARVWMVLMLAALGLRAAAAQGAPSGEIAFASDRSGIYQIYRMNADGSNVRPLTDNPFGASEPIWSPDGQKLLYVGGSDAATVDLMVMDADGSHPVSIAPEIVDPRWACAWSPDSQWLIYPVSANAFHRIKADGTGDQPLDFGTTDSPIQRVSFAPDGRSLFVVELNGVYAADLDGSHLRLLTDQIGAAAALSPDGQQIVGYDDAQAQIVEMQADGSAPKSVFAELTDPNRKDFLFYHLDWLDWSPDSRYVWGNAAIYADVATATPDIRTQNPDERLFIGTADGADYWLRSTIEMYVTWSPDSQWIAYTTQDANGHEQITISSPIGSGAAAITSQSRNFTPAWRPTGSP